MPLRGQLIHGKEGSGTEDTSTSLHLQTRPSSWLARGGRWEQWESAQQPIQKPFRGMVFGQYLDIFYIIMDGSILLGYKLNLSDIRTTPHPASPHLPTPAANQPPQSAVTQTQPWGVTGISLIQFYKVTTWSVSRLTRFSCLYRNSRRGLLTI
jgi:hypothetical protein